MQEVPPNITLFSCAAWRRHWELEMNYHSTFAARWLQCGVLQPSFRIDSIFGEIVAMSRPCKVSKGYRKKNPGRPLLKLPRVCIILYAIIFWSGSLKLAQSDIGQHSTSKWIDE